MFAGSEIIVKTKSSFVASPTSPAAAVSMLVSVSATVVASCDPEASALSVVSPPPEEQPVTVKAAISITAARLLNFFIAFPFLSYNILFSLPVLCRFSTICCKLRKNLCFCWAIFTASAFILPAAILSVKQLFRLVSIPNTTCHRPD